MDRSPPERLGPGVDPRESRSRKYCSMRNFGRATVDEVTDHIDHDVNGAGWITSGSVAVSTGPSLEPRSLRFAPYDHDDFVG